MTVEARIDGGKRKGSRSRRRGEFAEP
ncbi:uncharacterized protein G2W53_031855 [Senna tora]|uniref:Uncharacterized protein n=1 Tax=Senna tora TaxID=362788 RepID=A0A834SVP6_9FABA|nr:uncharacterized protein G2W53_031855 [Senna tora]